MNLNVKFWDLSQEERTLVKTHLKEIRDYLKDTSAATGREVSFDYDFGDPRTMNDGYMHSKTRHIYIRGRRRYDNHVIEYSVMGCSGCLNQALCEEDYDDKKSGLGQGWHDEYAMQLLKYWPEIKSAFTRYITGLQNASSQLNNFQL